MIKTVKNAALLTAILGTCATAGTVIAPNIGQLEISGDAELKVVQEKSGGTTVDKRTAEINLNVDAKASNGLNVFTQFQVYDDTQASGTADKTFDVVHAYVTVPVFEKGKLLAGLAPNNVYGTDAFENGGESWKIAAMMPVAEGIRIQLVSKIENEEEQDDNQGDSGDTALRIDGNFGDIQAGIKFGQAYVNKGDGLLGADAAAGTGDEEKEMDVVTGYVMGSVSGFDFGAEYISQDVTMVGAAAQPNDPKGYFLSVGTEVDALSAGLAYIKLQNGMKGGDDFAPGIILDGNVDSSAANDTSAFVVPLSYDLGDGISLNANYIGADVQGVDGNEIDFGVGYVVNDNFEVALDYGKFDGDAGCAIADQKNIELTLNITF